MGYTNGRFITYNRELISVCRGFHHLIKKYMHQLALVCTMYHSVIVLQLTYCMVYEQCHSRGEENSKRNLPWSTLQQGNFLISSNLERSNLRKRTKLQKHPPFTTQMEETQNVTYMCVLGRDC